MTVKPKFRLSDWVKTKDGEVFEIKFLGLIDGVVHYSEFGENDYYPEDELEKLR